MELFEDLRAAASTALELEDGATLYHQGERVEDVYLISAGYLKFTELEQSGSATITAILGAGQIFGEGLGDAKTASQTCENGGESQTKCGLNNASPSLTSTACGLFTSGDYRGCRLFAVCRCRRQYQPSGKFSSGMGASGQLAGQGRRTRPGPSGVHDVYATPESVKAFKQNGQGPDGTVLVKEISNIKQEQMTTGTAQWAGDTAVWFVMVRDRKNRFPDNKAWGEGWGWGWALFKADNPSKNTTTTWKGEGFNNCFGCHIPAKDTEWVFIEGYPTVHDAAQYGEKNDPKG